MVCFLELKNHSFEQKKILKFPDEIKAMQVSRDESLFALGF